LRGGDKMDLRVVKKPVLIVYLVCKQHRMNPFKKLQHYFIGGALAKTDDVFEQVKAEVLFNFTWFFFLTNLPYLFVATKSPLHMSLGVGVLVSLLIVFIILRLRSDTRLATYFFLINFAIQIYGHFLINNGLFVIQGTLFSLLFVACGYLLLDRCWGFTIGVAMIVTYIAGVYNITNNLALWSFPESMADPLEEGKFRYLAIIPLSLNIYLVSEFVKARQKAEKQLAEQKRMIEEKQKEILDSIHYAKRIQNALMPQEKYIARRLDRLQNK